MINNILFIVYLLGCVTLAPWYTLRALKTEFGDIDLADYVAAGFITLVGGWLWPLVMACRLAYICWVRYIPPIDIPMLRVRYIEPPTTYRERQEAKLNKRLAKKEKELELYRAWSQTENAGQPGYTFEEYMIDQSL